MQGGPVFGRGCSGALDVIPVGLVDRQHIGDLDHAFFQSLQLVAGAGQHQHQKKIGHVGDDGLRLTRADGLHQHHIVARRLADEHRLARFCRHAAERAGRR